MSEVKNERFCRMQLWAVIVLMLSLFLPVGVLSLPAQTVMAADNKVEEWTESEEDENVNVKINVTSKSIAIGASYGLIIYNVSEDQSVVFTSSDTSVATVDETGIVTGVANGQTTITAAVYTGEELTKKLRCSVKVAPAALNVRFITPEVVIIQGRRMALKSIFVPYNCVKDVTYYSSNSKTVHISTSGRIAAKKVGVAYVYIILPNGKYDVCKVTVVSQEDYDTMIENAEKASEGQEEN